MDSLQDSKSAAFVSDVYLWCNVCLQHFPIAFCGEFQIFLLYGAFLKIGQLFLAVELQHRIAEWLRLDLWISSSPNIYVLSFEAHTCSKSMEKWDKEMISAYPSTHPIFPVGQWGTVCSFSFVLFITSMVNNQTPLLLLLCSCSFPIHLYFHSCSISKLS